MRKLTGFLMSVLFAVSVAGCGMAGKFGFITK